MSMSETFNVSVGDRFDRSHIVFHTNFSFSSHLGLLMSDMSIAPLETRRRA